MLKLMLTSRETKKSILVQVATIEETEQKSHGPYCYYVWDINGKLLYVESESEIVQALYENGQDFAYAKWGKDWFAVE